MAITLIKPVRRNSINVKKNHKLCIKTQFLSLLPDMTNIAYFW